jgi:diguanylate cyclase (GGDEF)-like protein
VVRDDLAALRALLAGPRPVVAILASEYVAALHPRTPASIPAALMAAGFSAVETTVLGEEVVASAYQQLGQQLGPGGVPRIRSTCPVVTEWVRRFYPQLTGALVPIVPPYVAQARLVRELYTDDVAVVYVSPCWARKDEPYMDGLRADVDLVVGFDELRTLLDSTAAAPPSPLARPLGHARVTKQLSGVDGFPRVVLERAFSHDVATARGIAETDRLLKAIVDGEAAPAFVDALACDGCISGQCVAPALSVYARRNLDVAARERQPEPVVGSRDLLGVIPRVELGRRFEPVPADMTHPDAPPARVAPGATRSPASLAEPLAPSLAGPRAGSRVPARADATTGLPTSDDFAIALEAEMARATRYGFPLSLLLIEPDGLALADAAPDARARDRLLVAAASVLRTSLRESDFAGSLGDGRLAVVLPHAAKTEAWAVAEKICRTMRGLRMETDGPDRVATTASIGVASRIESEDSADGLLGAALEALQGAKGLGGDQVVLSAG